MLFSVDGESGRLVCLCQVPAVSVAFVAVVCCKARQVCPRPSHCPAFDCCMLSHRPFCECCMLSHRPVFDWCMLSHHLVFDCKTRWWEGLGTRLTLTEIFVLGVFQVFLFHLFLCNNMWNFFHVHVLILQSLVSKGLTASSWVKAVTDVTGGKGGGSNVAAQASAPTSGKLSEALSVAKEFAKLKLEWTCLKLGFIKVNFDPKFIY